MIQFKLFELFHSNEEHTNMINNSFDSERILVFNEKYLGITYDQKYNSYVDLLRKVKEINLLRQVLITPSVFFNILEQAVINEYTIKDLKFISPVPEESFEFVQFYINKLNSGVKNISKTKALDELKGELDWLIYDESIDIEKISFLIGEPDQFKPYIQVEFFNNGIITVNSNEISEELSKLIRSALT